MRRPTDAELDAWLTPWGYPPPGEQRDNSRFMTAAYVHSHPCPDGEGHPTQSIWPDGPGGLEHVYRWQCEHESHAQPVNRDVVPPFPRDAAAGVWRAEHAHLEA